MIQKVRSVLGIKGFGSPPTQGLLLLLVHELTDRWQHFLFGSVVDIPLHSFLDLDVIRLVKAHALLGNLLDFFTHC